MRVMQRLLARQRRLGSSASWLAAPAVKLASGDNQVAHCGLIASVSTLLWPVGASTESKQGHLSPSTWRSQALKEDEVSVVI